MPRITEPIARADNGNANPKWARQTTGVNNFVNALTLEAITDPVPQSTGVSTRTFVLAVPFPIEVANDDATALIPVEYFEQYTPSNTANNYVRYIGLSLEEKFLASLRIKWTKTGTDRDENKYLAIDLQESTDDGVTFTTIHTVHLSHLQRSARDYEDSNEAALITPLNNAVYRIITDYQGANQISITELGLEMKGR